MPSTDHPYRIQGLKMNRREVLRYAVVAGVGLVAIPLVDCGKDEEEAKATATPVATTTAVPPSGSFDSDGVKIHYETLWQRVPHHSDTRLHCQPEGQLAGAELGGGQSSPSDGLSRWTAAATARATSRMTPRPTATKSWPGTSST